MISKEVKEYFALRKKLLEENNFIYSLIKQYREGKNYTSMAEVEKSIERTIRYW
jgi:hypothetical protein